MPEGDAGCQSRAIPIVLLLREKLGAIIFRDYLKTPLAGWLVLVTYASVELLAMYVLIHLQQLALA